MYDGSLDPQAAIFGGCPAH